MGEGERKEEVPDFIPVEIEEEFKEGAGKGKGKGEKKESEECKGCEKCEGEGEKVVEELMREIGKLTERKLGYEDGFVDRCVKMIREVQEKLGEKGRVGGVTVKEVVGVLMGVQGSEEEKLTVALYMGCIGEPQAREFIRKMRGMEKGGLEDES